MSTTTASAKQLLVDKRLLLVVGLAVVAVYPFLFTAWHTDLVTRILILAIFGIGFNIAFGFTDLASFGHAAFYGLGAYGVAMTITYASPEMLAIPIIIGIAAAVVYGIITAWFSTKGRGIYFALITFAFAQLLYEVFLRWTEVTGGSEGQFFSLPTVFGIDFGSTMTMYYLTFVVFAIVAVAGYRLINSPFGNVMKAIRHNEDRASAIGYPVRRVKVTVFTISSGIAAVAGVLHAMNNRFVSPEVMFFEMSIEVLVISIIGGAAYFTGPIVGAAIFIVLHEFTRDLADVGIVITGIIFVIVIMFLPEGVVGYTKEKLRSAGILEDE